MIIKNVSLETVCGITSKLPDSRFPEVAFAGKSNVGKSSLIKDRCMDAGYSYDNCSSDFLFFSEHGILYSNRI